MGLRMQLDLATQGMHHYNGRVVGRRVCMGWASMGRGQKTWSLHSAGIQEAGGRRLVHRGVRKTP